MRTDFEESLNGFGALSFTKEGLTVKWKIVEIFCQPKKSVLDAVQTQ